MLVCCVFSILLVVVFEVFLYFCYNNCLSGGIFGVQLFGLCDVFGIYFCIDNFYVVCVCYFLQLCVDLFFILDNLGGICVCWWVEIVFGGCSEMCNSESCIWYVRGYIDFDSILCFGRVCLE